MRIDAPIITGSFSLNGDALIDLNILTTTGSNAFIGDQTITGSLAINDSATNFLIEGNSFGQTYLTAGGAIVLNPGYGGVEMVGSNRTFKATDITAEGFVSGEIRANNGVVSGSSQVIGILSSLNSYTSSQDTKNTTLGSYTGSNDTKWTSIGNLTGSYATTGSNTFFGTQTYSGSVYIANDLVVQGSSSIQYISASSVSIGTNIVQLNTANPSVRFAGLTIIDSGSVGGSGSFLYDSVHDEFVFVHRGNGTNVTSSHFVLGPETYDSLGNETYLTTNILTKGTGKEHLVDSCIFDNGTTTCIKNNLIGTGTTCFQSDVYINGDLRMSGNDSFIWSPLESSTGFTGFYDAYNSQIALMVCNNSGHLLLQPARCNVGIGTNNPTNKLTISNNGDAVVAFKINDTNANASFLSLNASNTDSAIIAGGTSAIPFDIYTGGSPRMRITSTGNVGIGITTPFSNAKLQVNVGANMNFAVQPGTACTTGIKLNTFVDSGASNVPLELNGNILYLKTCENSRLVINGSGISCFACQVYVGTDKLCWTDTTFKTLQVGNGAFNNINNQTQIVNNIYYDDANYRSLIGGASNRLIMTTSGNLFFEYACVATAGSVIGLDPKFFICGTSGRVGIGTITPEYPLHIYGCSPLGMKIQTCGSSFGSPGINLLNGGVDTVLSATNNGLEIGTWSANDIIFKVTQVERMRINTSGIVTMPFQPSMFAQPGAGAFPIGHNQTAYGWCTSGSVRYNCGFTLTTATSAACNIADAQNTGKIIIPATGKYLLQFSQRNEAQCTSDGQFFLWVNGTTRIRRHIELWSTTRYIHVDVTAILPLNTGDCLEMGAWFNGNGKTDTFAGTNDTVNWMSLAKIS